MDPGSIITLVTLAYTGAVKAWTVLHSSLHFAEEAQDLLLRLSLERFRLQTWGSSVGLESGSFQPSLFPIFSLIQQILQRIENICNLTDALKDRYGLFDQVDSESKTRRAKDLIRNTQLALRGSGVYFPVSDEIESNADQDRDGVSTLKRLRWGLRDKTRFANLINELESYVRKLNELLQESQRKDSFAEQTRVNIVVIGQARDENSVDLIRKALEGGANRSKIQEWAERKSIVDQGRTLVTRKGPEVLRPLHAEDFDLPTDLKMVRRAFAHQRNQTEDAFLLERRSYGGVESKDKNILLRRLQNLVLLLSSHVSSDSKMLKSVGYLDDVPNECWWILYCFPSVKDAKTNIIQPTVTSHPVNLLALLKHQASYARPALEQRFHLASLLADTLSSLFSSGWMHKSLRSENILFPFTWKAKDPTELRGFKDVSSPLLAGFEYSRQETEQQTIDKGKCQPLDIAIYRHPSYQGEPAAGYSMWYDIYSFGLMLLEIAYWRPLISFLDTKDVRSEAASDKQSLAIILSSKMHHFHIDEAEALRQRLLKFVAQDLAFRVGTSYCKAVTWCLNCAEPGSNTALSLENKDDPQDDWRPALAFYDNVAEPLARLLGNLPA